jgi:hypothetical protein
MPLPDSDDGVAVAEVPSLEEEASRAAPRPLADLEHPWLGLESFREETRAYFFGRDAEITELHLRLRSQPRLVLYGRSGFGKTSVLSAGVIPRLRREGHRSPQAINSRAGPKRINRQGKQGPSPAGVQQVQGKAFQIKSASRDFQAVIPGLDAPTSVKKTAPSSTPTQGCRLLSPRPLPDVSFASLPRRKRTCRSRKSRPSLLTPITETAEQATEAKGQKGNRSSIID